MKIRNFLLSKWLSYILFAVFLLALLLLLLPSVWEGSDIATNILSEVFGLFMTLVIFVMFFEWRDRLEWKVVKSRIEKRIGGQIFALFMELSMLCEARKVLKGDLDSEASWKELKKKQLEELTSKKVTLNKEGRGLWENREFASSLALLIDSRRDYLAEVEGKYRRFLDSQLQASLMDVQEYLTDLRLELRVARGKKEDFCKSISDLISRIMKEIANIRKRGIYIGF